ncbi:PilC/PilY family type IV pilus protein [Luteimonas composti]|uniref:PilC/PilY family type IV pilus protein n=1 Tax=Luteimonas composti TaxID=398257 RepID=A0ABT6MU80_9GAMM|nr:PilC/PilY family type IV pilus protein [Luteimonas composti]MDH7454170.1 PilC/PilY family type IV pilus protein [Luteimonas composti]
MKKTTSSKSHAMGRPVSYAPAPIRAAAMAFFATMLAWPASANFVIPDDPLTTGSRVPPNILFILDDSGSMAFDAMPASAVSNTWTTRTYVHNAVYYNPAKDYQPWVGADGHQLTGGTDYDAVYGSFNLVGGNTIDLADENSCRRYNKNQTPVGTDEFTSGGTEVCGGTQTFYVPKNTANTDPTYLGTQANYYRFQILPDRRVIRSELLAYSSDNTPGDPSTDTLGDSGTGTINAGSYRPAWNSWVIDVPANAYNLVISSSGGGGSGRAADLYVRRGADPTTGQYDHRGIASGNAEVVTVASPLEARYHVRLYAQTNFTGRVTVTYSYETRDGSTGCSISSSGTAWRNCTEITPTGRTAAAERQNYATWFSYHRTRMKAAKAGASAAFSELGNNVRVGFRTIWQRNGGQTTTNWPRQAVPIPVEYNDGLFEDVTISGTTHDNRSKWYSRLHNSIGQSGTPLHGALHQAGQYFSSDAATGPYGPQSGSAQLACRQNFTILTTDGYWNDWSNYPSGSRVGNADGTSSDTINEPSTGASYTYTASAPFSDSHGGSEGTLADVAMHYWKTDLREGMRNIVPTNGSTNPAFWQHMVTFGLSIGLTGNTGFRSVGEVPADYNAWPDPMPSENATRIDDLLHAAVNSRGAFVAASDPDEFTEGLRSALAAIVERTGSFSNVAANSTSLDAGTRVFQANYVSSVWTGELRSQPVSVSGGAETVDCSGPNQPANGWCASKGIPSSGRKVYTSNGHFDGVTRTPTTSNAIPLAFPSNATTAQLASLQRQGPLLPAPVSGANNAAYIAGARTLEQSQTGGYLRNRNHLLGDIIGSSPAFVPETNTIYVGANDGMLHAIDAANGNELFAYLPGIINWKALGNLSRPDYSHQYFVDGPVVVSSRQQTPGQNILVGALGKGGKGLFALDVTTPASFGASANIEWERADTPLGNMGLVLGRPILARVNDATAGKNAVLLGNGLNSTSGRAALIVLDLATGDVIREIAVGPTGTSNGLSAPTGVLGPDGRTLAYVYAGDMLGNVWKFDLTSAAPAEWSGTSLFTASAGGVSQPITGALTIATHPLTNQRWIFFGTGRYITAEDVGSVATQSMYGFVDDGTAIVRAGTGANLTQRTVEVTTGVTNGYPVRGFQEKTPLPAGSKGWFIDLPVAGERVVQDAQVVATFLITASIIPTGDACESGGSGFINALDAFTGTSAGGSYFDLDGDGTTTDEVVGDRPVGSVNVGGGMPTLPNLLRGRFVVGGSAGSDVRGTRTLSPRWDRASWREIRGE